MICFPVSRNPLFGRGWRRAAALAALGSALAAWAQTAAVQQPNAPAYPAKSEMQAPAVDFLPELPSLQAEIPAASRGEARAGGLSFSLWDRRPLDAARWEMGGRARRFTPLAPDSGLPGLERGAGYGGFATGGPELPVNGFRPAAPGEFYLNQLTRSDAAMKVRSPLGNFGFAYQDPFGPRGYGLGSGMGTARTTFSSTPFGGGLFDFSSSFNFGRGTSLISTRNGFSAGVLNGSGMGAGAAGPGLGLGAKKPSSSLSLKLSF